MSSLPHLDVCQERVYCSDELVLPPESRQKRSTAYSVLCVFRCGGRLSDITAESRCSQSASADIPLRDAGAWPLTRKC